MIRKSFEEEKKTNPCVKVDHQQYIYMNDQLFLDDEILEIHQYLVHYHHHYQLLSNDIEF